jgi:hypothetical protein
MFPDDHHANETYTSNLPHPQLDPISSSALAPLSKIKPKTYAQSHRMTQTHDSAPQFTGPPLSHFPSSQHTLSHFTEPISPPSIETTGSSAPPVLERQGSLSKVAHIAKKLVQSPSEPTTTESLDGRTVQETINQVKSDKPTDIRRMEA